MKRMIIYLFIFLLFFSCEIINAVSKNIDAPSYIRSVTVFSNRATVKRDFKRTYEPGKYRLKFSHLPLSLIDESMRVSGKGLAEAKVLNVKVKREYFTVTYKKQIRELEKEKAKIEKSQKALSDRMSALTKKEQLLDSLAKKTTEMMSNKKTVSPPSLSEWKGMIDFLENQLVEIYSKKRDIDEKKEELEMQKREIDKKLSQDFKTRRKEEKTAYVDIEVKKGGSLTVGVSYMIHGASWRPVYDLRIGSESKRGSLIYSAMVQQQTGEDWKNVNLTLSTAKPLSMKKMPELSPIYIGQPGLQAGDIYGTVCLEDRSPIPGVAVALTNEKVVRKTTVTKKNGAFKFIQLPSGNYDLKFELEGFKTIIRKGVRTYGGKISKVNVVMGLAAIMEEITVTGKVEIVDRRRKSMLLPGGVKEMEMETSDVSDQGISKSFKLRHRDSILMGREPQKVTIAAETVSVDKEYMVIPKLSGNTYLEARVKNTTNYPLLAGTMNVFFEGTFVNKSSIGFINPGEKFELPVGVDEAIKVNRETLSQKSKGKGILKKKVKRELGYKITVKNLHKSSVNVTIRDQIPVSMSKTVEVSIKSITPNPIKEKEKEVKKDGFLKWNLKLKPGEERVIQVLYEVVHPRGIQLEEWH